MSHDLLVCNNIPDVGVHAQYSPHLNISFELFKHTFICLVGIPGASHSIFNLV